MQRELPLFYFPPQGFFFHLLIWLLRPPCYSSNRICPFLNLEYVFQVTRADYLSGRTALHFAAVNGHVRCIRLVVADFVPSAPFDSINSQADADRGDSSNSKCKHEQRWVICLHLFVFILVIRIHVELRQRRRRW